MRTIKRPETSQNHSLALSYAGSRLQATASLNHNRIRDFAVLDSGASDPVSGEPITLFTSAERPVTVQGVDLNASWQADSALQLQLGLEANRYRFEPGTLVFARPSRRAFIGLDWDREPWELTARLSWTGAMNLLPFHGSERYNLNGTAKRSKSPAFFTLDLRAERELGAGWSAYLGVDNAGNRRQTDTESPLFVDAAGAVDVVQIWGPNRGRYVYAGLKLAL